MKYQCVLCLKHFDYQELKRHAVSHKRERSLTGLFVEIKTECPSCHKMEMTKRFGKMICQCCSHKYIMYAAMTNKDVDKVESEKVVAKSTEEKKSPEDFMSIYGLE